MIYVCVPVLNESRTAGLVLWKVRQVFTAFQREYHLLACDDGSTDGTAEVLATYARVLPMTVVSHRERQGYARSVEELLLLALQRTDRPKRDCAIVLHADFVHSPAVMEEMVKRLESGADLVVAEQLDGLGQVPRPLRWARRWAPRLLRVPGVRDTVSGFVALRLIVLRQAARVERDRPSRPSGAPGSLLTTEGWCANAELLARLAPQARRVETITAAARYDLHQRPSRVQPWRQLVEVWRARAAIRAARAALLALLLVAGALRAQTDSAEAAPLPAPAAPAVPFAIGERLRYQAKFGIFSVGGATLQVAGIDTLRGEETVHFLFHLAGGALWYHIDQTMDSWVGRWDFRSRRFVQETEERGKKRHAAYDIFPDSGYYRLEGRDTTFATTADPLDDAAFLFWIRTVPLEVGRRYEYTRYFRPDRNPVIVVVLKRERVRVPAGEFPAIVVRPIIPRGRGIFAEQAEARMWLSDDNRRMMLKLQSNFSFGTVTLRLKEYSAPPASPALPAPPERP